MKLWLCCSVLALGALGQKTWGPYPSITNKTFIKICVDVHNKYRREVNPPATDMRYMVGMFQTSWKVYQSCLTEDPVHGPARKGYLVPEVLDILLMNRTSYQTWDQALARTAEAWAHRCIFEHNHLRKQKGGGHPDPKYSPIGENLWIGNAQKRPFDPTGAIGAWWNEVRFYNYHSNKCTKVCGHYTQVVWSTTFKVGCAIVLCPTMGRHKNIENFVCNYATAGNYPWHPYATGRPCSKCPKGDSCERNLCRNPERDKIRRYPRWYPPWAFRIVCEEYCISVAILRPLLMFLLFGTVYYIKLQKPGLSLRQ